MSNKLLEMDYKAGEFTLRFTPGRLRLLPEETLGHLRTANKEVLIAMRSVLDSFIEKSDPEKGESQKRRTRIHVDEEEKS